MPLNALRPEVLAKLANIQLIIFDIDGVMTDGKLYFSASGDTLKGFNAKDGLGLKMLMQSGIEVAIITGRTSAIVAQRAKELGIEQVYQGQKNKVIAYDDCQQHFKLAAEHIAYMGDDINDIPVMRKVGLSIAPANAQYEVQEIADYTCKVSGGDGAVREVCDMILKTQDKWQQAIEAYGN
jgi:3-deoxy-D-manno-octulosonate 8-phosphate phosphatase (KDO 8-P phosphatase)